MSQTLAFQRLRCAVVSTLVSQKKPMKKKLLFLLILPFMLAPAPAQARCIVNQSSVMVRVDISFLMFQRIQDGVKAGETRCFPYNFLAYTRLDAITDDPYAPKDYDEVVTGTAEFFLTTNNTKITVTDGRRWKGYRFKYMELAFAREN